MARAAVSGATFTKGNKVGTELDTDQVLLARVRDDGDAEAFGCLYERHAAAARRFARSLCANDADADDLTAEVFTGLLATLRRGNGPTQLALPYLFASIKHRHWRTARRRARETALASTTGPSAAYDAADIVEAEVVLTALSTLPAGVQALLWRTEVDDQSVDVAAEWDAMSAHNLAVYRHRARRALGTAYLAQHAEPDGGVTGLDPECQQSLPHLASLVRGKIGARRRRLIERHLADCAHCCQVRQRLELINTRLRSHPRLPWSFWTAGLTTIKAQVSGWLGTSAVTLAGSSVLAAAAILVPAPALMERLDGHDSAAAATSTERPSRAISVADAGSASRPRRPDASTEHPGGVGGAAWFRVPSSPLPGPATEPQASNPSTGGPAMNTTTTSEPPPLTVAVSPAALPRDDVAAEVASSDVAAASPGPTRAPTAQGATDSDENGTQSGRDDEQGSGHGDGQRMTGASPDGPGNGQGKGNGNTNGQRNGNGNATDNGDANGQDKDKDKDKDKDNGQDGHVVEDGQNTAADQDAPNGHVAGQSGTGGQASGNGQGVAKGHAKKASLGGDDGVLGDAGAAPVTRVEEGELSS
jgi:DNA-directed RNA polymerase specialized sigma24 family protein